MQRESRESEIHRGLETWPGMRCPGSATRDPEPTAAAELGEHLQVHGVTPDHPRALSH